jgi:hypothetical protein
MTSQIIIKTQDNKELVLEFLDNPFVAEFILHLKKIKDLFVLNFYRERIPAPRSPFLATETKQQLEQRLINAIDALNAMGLSFPVPAEEIKLGTSLDTQHLLNRLHRHFTTGHRSVSLGESTTTWLDNSSHTFKLDPTKFKEFSYYVHEINSVVHESEGHIVNDRQLNFTPRYEYQFLFESTQPKDPNNNPQEIYFQKIKPEHFQYFTDQLKYDVWLPLYQIQGKNYWVSYFDYDDPTHWDVSTNIVYSGSFAVGDRSVTRDPAILEYLRSYGIEPGPLHCGMPLGKVISGKEILTTLTTNNISQIVINE